MTRFAAGLILLLILPTCLHANENPKVVVTIKPLHSLVQGVMGDTGDAGLLIRGNASPHGFSLKPSQVGQLQRADIVFYIDEAFENFLKNALDTLPETISKVPLAEAEGVVLLERREGGAWDEDQHGHHHGHSHGHDEHNHAGAADNLHLWLDPTNAVYMTRKIADELSRHYPENQDIYQENAERQIGRIHSLDAELRVSLSALAGLPYIVLHDAYPYFERHYNVLAVGSLTLEPNEPASAKRIKDIRNKMRETGALCIFREPQFDDRLLRTAAEGMQVKLGVLDPVGADLEPGEELYLTLMRNLADNLSKCLIG
jgi:zinc transport system substrate-binding protein